MKQKIVNHQDLDGYRRAFDAAMAIFHLSKAFPKEEQYALTDQIRRSSRSICANLAEGWRRRRYEQAFINKLSFAEGEAAETQVWLEHTVECGYCQREAARELYKTYAGIIATIVGMINHAATWIVAETRLRESPERYSTTDIDDPNEQI